MPTIPIRQFKTFTTWCIATFLFWTVLLFFSVVFFIENEWQNADNLGKELGYSALQNDYMYRSWNAEHGGVYVPVTEKTQPNPHLAHIPDRDVQIKGRDFTLVNPAYMTRQVGDLEQTLYGSRTRITSLNVLHEGNSPDAWEIDALKRFEAGETVVEELVEIEGEPFMRVMTPMVTKGFCLKCHAEQGYKEGDIRGGISVAIPMKEIITRKHSHLLYAGILHTLIYFFGVTGLITFYRINTRHFAAMQRAESELREQQLLLQGVVDNISSGIAIFTPVDGGGDFLIEKMNPAGLAIVEMEEQEVLGRKAGMVFSGLKDSGFLDIFRRVMQSGRSESYPVSKYEGKQLLLWLENYVFKLPTGELVAVFDDVTEKKITEEMLLQKTNEWEKTFDAIPDIITLQDKDRKIIRANQAACNFFDITPTGLIGSTCHNHFRGRDTPCPECPGTEAMRDCRSHSGIIEHKNLGKTFQLNVAPVVEQNGEVRHFVYVAKDITETLRLEQELMQADKMQAIGTLAGGIAHDFNNILSAITGYAELAEGEIPDEHKEVKRDLDLVVRAAQRATELVKQILTFSRKAGQEKKPLRIVLVIKEAMHMMRSSLPSTVRITTDYQAKGDMVLADPTCIHQVVVNLCTNALHAMKDQKGVLSVSLRREEVSRERISGEWGARGGKYVVLRVKDSGRGMDERVKKQIFDPYFTTKERGEGTGLGLATVHGIVKDCEGFVEVESTLGKGTLFTVYLPLWEADLPDQYTGQTNTPFPRGTERILVIDDEVPLCDIVMNQLGKLGYNVTAVNDSRKALELFYADPNGFDLVVSDQTMPEVTGADLAEKMLAFRPDLPFILSTGYTSAITEEQALAMGIKRFIVKPFSRRVLAENVRDVLDGKKRE